MEKYQKKSEFAEDLERDKDELTEFLSEISSKIGTSDLAKTRTSELYSSVKNLRNSNVITILRYFAISE